MGGTLFDMIDDEFDKLAGSVVRESTKQRRSKLELVMSLVQGEPFHTRTVKSADYTSSNSTSATFRSFELWRALQMLSIEAALQLPYTDKVSIEELISALQLNHTRVVTVPGKRPALETTLSDTQHLIQSLLGIHHAILPPLRSVGLGSLSVRNNLNPRSLSTDGVTASTRSPFTLVRQGLSRHGALSAVGTHGSRISLQQLDRKLDVLMLSEVFGDRELTIAVNIERGLTAIVLGQLQSRTDGEERKVEEHGGMDASLVYQCSVCFGLGSRGYHVARLVRHVSL